jgi:hypothetical protein
LTTVEHIKQILAGAGFKELSKPFAVSSLPFDFAAAFIGGPKTLDLIVVADLFVEKNENRLVQKIQSLGRALDLAESRRSLTAVLVGNELDPIASEAIGSICRVLSIGTPPSDSVDQYLRDWLAVLLPLPVMDTTNALADWKAELKSQMGKRAITAFYSAIVEAAPQGSDPVENVLSTRLQKEVSKALREKSK